MRLSTAFVLIGVALLVMGALAMANPFAASLAVTSLVGIVFMISGVAQAWVEFKAGPHQGRRRNGLVALLTIVAAVWLLANPLAGTLSLTILLGAIFFLMGFVRLAMAASLRGAPFFLLVLLSGVASLAIGLMVLFDVGAAATTFLGILLGIQLLAEGAALVAFGLIARHRGY